jgi:hypothetical protein
VVPRRIDDTLQVCVPVHVGVPNLEPENTWSILVICILHTSKSS